MKKSVNVQRVKLLPLKNVLESLQDVTTNCNNVDLAYYAMKNIEAIGSELKFLDENPLLQPPAEFKEYQQELAQTAQKHAKKNEDGTVLEEDGKIHIEAQNIEAYRAEVTELAEKYTATLEAVKEVDERRIEFIEKECDVTLYTFPRSLLGELKTEGKPSGWVHQVMVTLDIILDEDE